MVFESMYAGTFSEKTTEQAFQYFDYLANWTSDWVCTGNQNNVSKSFTIIPTQHVAIKYQLAMEDDLNAKFTILSKLVETLALAKAATHFTKDTSTMCALCDIMDLALMCVQLCWGSKKHVDKLRR